LYYKSLLGIPTDGSHRLEVPAWRVRLPVVRVCADIGGWQGCGEWSLLLPYTRSKQFFDDHANGVGLTGDGYSSTQVRK
jgi:hypothetical protein